MSACTNLDVASLRINCKQLSSPGGFAFEPGLLGEFTKNSGLTDTQLWSVGCQTTFLNYYLAFYI